MLAFRDGRRTIDPRARTRALDASFERGHALDALLRASELECALADAGAADAVRIEPWTDAAAMALVSATPLRRPAAPLPEPRASLRASVPEGFAYYALHPLDHARAAREAIRDGAPALVVGIRTIGVALSAVAAASLRCAGSDATRVTVRPTGDPFARRLALPQRARDAARAVASRPGAWALVADEGPGLSGSSFLAVADALIDAGVPRDRVVLLPSHDPDPSCLRAPDAARRWTALRRVVARPTRARPAAAGRELSGGAWRAIAYPDARAWPATWPAMERRKYLSQDGRAVLKFEGLGFFGAAARERAELLADRGLGPAGHAIGDGFVAWERARGRPLDRRVDPPPLDLLARAIAARLALPRQGEPDRPGLAEMVRTNTRELLGREIELALPIARPVIADGRLAAHEWIADRDRIVKTDAIAHGDDHFFPGPCDVAWDLAGAIAEWDLDDAAADALLDRYVRESGDRDARARLPDWTVAYRAFRAGWLAVARDACPDDRRDDDPAPVERGCSERARLDRAAHEARARLARAAQEPRR